MADKNSNTYLTLLKKNKGKLDDMRLMYNKAKKIYSLLESDIIPSTATEKYKEAKKKQKAEIKKIVSDFEKFVDSEKTQTTINKIYLSLLTVLKPYNKLGI